MPKSIFIFICTIFLPVTAMASDDEYVMAYRACTPVAVKSAREQCNYGNVFENFYLKCMHKYGYSDDNSEQDNYVQAYKYCSSVADRGTKENCNYGGLYHQEYNQCLRQYGFNEYGEKMAEYEQQYFKFDF